MVMMKHLQEPVPSVLDERSDVPATVGRVIARAMAKLPTNRYQTVAEMVEDLTIASGMAQFAPVPAQKSVAAAPQIPFVSDDADEVTVVRTRQEPAPPFQPAQRRAPVMVPVQSPAMPPPATSFNPLKVLIPSVAAVLVVFAVIYALKLNSTASENSNVNQPQQTLAADPNSQPVQPGASPTGKGEDRIPAGGTIPVPANLNASPNANDAVSPEPVEDVSPAANVNANENSNAKTNSNSNSNRKSPALPEPTKSVVPEAVPSPVATKPPDQPSPIPTPTSPF